MVVGYKLGDVIVIYDVLTRVNMKDATKSTENADYIRNNKEKMLQRAPLLSNVILPTPLEDTIKKQIRAHGLLGPEHRQNELDVLSLKVSELKLLCEVESEIFVQVSINIGHL